MGALGLLTYRALLRKLDLSCLTAGPLISPVKGRRLCRSGFYRRFPFTEVFTFYDHFNKFWPGTNSALSGVDVMIISGLSFEASTHTHIHTHNTIWAVCGPLSSLPPSSPCSVMPSQDSDVKGEDAGCWMSLQMTGVSLQVSLYLQLNHLTEQASLLVLFVSDCLTAVRGDKGSKR